jgi:hypothetical protein
MNEDAEKYDIAVDFRIWHSNLSVREIEECIDLKIGKSIEKMKRGVSYCSFHICERSMTNIENELVKLMNVIDKAKEKNNLLFFDGFEAWIVIAIYSNDYFAISIDSVFFRLLSQINCGISIENHC